MSFDDVLQPRRRGEEDSPKPKPTSKPNPSAKGGGSLFENLDIQQIGRQMGLSDELTQQVIVPLVAILDKHGGRIVDSQSAEVQAVSSLASTLGDFAPLLQGAYQYFSGVRKELNEADEALLEAHSAALSATELSNLFGSEDELVLENESEAQPVEQEQQQNVFGPDGFEPPRASQQILQTGKVDYYALMGYGSESQYTHAMGEATTTPDSIYTDQQQRNEQQAEVRSDNLPEKNAGITSIDSLTLENGLTPYEVKRNDTTTKINQGLAMDSVEITQTRVQNDIDEIQRMMQQESLNRQMTSKTAHEEPTMTAEEIIADMKAKAKPGKGGQQTGEPRKMNQGMNKVTDAAISNLASNAFAIPGLAELQAAEASQMKASSKMDETAQEVRKEEEKPENPFNQTLIPLAFEEVQEATQANELTVVDDISMSKSETNDS